MDPVNPLDFVSASQRTLIRSVQVSGVGLHSGEPTSCRFCPADVNTGIYFVRVDLPGSPSIPAHWTQVMPAHLSSALSQGDASIQTPEHSLAALAGLGIDNCRIEVNGPEIPILDGSALPFVEALLSAGIQAQAAPRELALIEEPITVYHKDAFISAIPGPDLRFTYGIDFPGSPIQQQWYSWTLTAGVFVTAIAPARTFTRERDIERAKQQGLIKGGSLENAIVCTEKSWHTPLRFPDEPVRHKLIDLLGDLYLLGIRLQGHVLAYKAGHSLHHELSQHLAQQLHLPSKLPS